MSVEWKLNFDKMYQNSSNNESATQSNASGSPLLPFVAATNPDVFISNASGNGYPILYVNGCRKYGPPINWEGPEPSADCELYIKDLPKEFREHQLIPHFERFGRIYEFRLMMDYDNNNRGYAYVRYSTTEEASFALEVMKHFLLLKKKLSIQKSYHKCRLFVSNLPNDVPEAEIVAVFKNMFPKMTKMVVHMNNHQNRAFGFIEFADHKNALDAKKQSAPGYMELFNREIKIVWAFPEKTQDQEVLSSVTTLFIRNIGLSATAIEIKAFLASVVPKSSIKHISTVRDFAFVEFTNRNVAEIVKNQLAGKKLKSSTIEIEWARPPSDNSIHVLKKTDFYVELRLTCMANYWDIPIYLYGRAFEDIEVQVIAVIIKVETVAHQFFIEMSYKALSDIQSRSAEILITLINHLGCLPKEHLVIKAEGDFFTVVGFVRYQNCVPLFVPSGQVNKEIRIFWDEIYDLALVSEILGGIDTLDLLGHYQMQIQKPGLQYLQHVNINGRIVGCYNTTRRQKTPLKYGLASHEITLVLCDAFTKSNAIFLLTKPVVQYPLHFFYANGVEILSAYFISESLLPLRFVQSKRHGQTPDRIVFGATHPFNCGQFLFPFYPQSQLMQMPHDEQFRANLPAPIRVHSQVLAPKNIIASHSSIF